MNIRIPRFLINAGTKFTDWGDIPVYQYKRLIIRRIDLLTAAAGTLCVGYYGYTGGWRGALVGFFAFAFVAMIALWLL